MTMVTEVKIDLIEMRKAGYCCWVVRVGCVDIGTVFSPRKGQRDYYIARLLFNQERGKYDFKKDKHFKTFEECTAYIHKKFKQQIKILARYYKI